MSLSNEQLVDVLKAAITTASTEGISSPQDADSFVDMSREQTAILQELRVETGIKTSFNLDSLALAEQVMVAGTEITAPAAGDVVAPSRTRRRLRGCLTAGRRENAQFGSPHPMATASRRSPSSATGW